MILDESFKKHVDSDSLIINLIWFQIVLWVVVPYLIRRGATTEVMTVLLIMFIFQYLPKIYHSVCLLRRMQKFSGYVFGTIWWGFALNMIVYFVASHVSLISLPFFMYKLHGITGWNWIKIKNMKFDRIWFKYTTHHMTSYIIVTSIWNLIV